jgi:hypothetical protein
MTMRDYFHELYGDDPFDDERRVVPDGGSVRAPDETCIHARSDDRLEQPDGRYRHLESGRGD